MQTDAPPSWGETTEQPPEQSAVAVAESPQFESPPAWDETLPEPPSESAPSRNRLLPTTSWKPEPPKNDGDYLGKDSVLDSTNFGKAFLKSFHGMAGSLVDTARAILPQSDSLDEAARLTHEQAENIKVKGESLGDIHGIGDVADYVSAKIGELAPVLATAYVGGVMGGATKLGKFLGTAAPFVATGIGEEYSGIERDTGEKAPLTAIGAGTVKGLLMSVPVGGWLESVFKAGTPEIKRLVWRDVVANTIKELPKAAALHGTSFGAISGASEGLHQVANKIADSSYDLVTADNWQKVLHATIEGAGTGALLGVGGAPIGKIKEAIAADRNHQTQQADVRNFWEGAEAKRGLNIESPDEIVQGAIDRGFNRITGKRNAPPADISGSQPTEQAITPPSEQRVDAPVVEPIVDQTVNTPVSNVAEEVATPTEAQKEAGGEQRRKAVTETGIDDFKKWLKEGDTKKEFAPPQPEAKVEQPAENPARLATATLRPDQHFLFNSKRGDVATTPNGGNIFIVGHYDKMKDADGVVAALKKEGVDSQVEAWLAKSKSGTGKSKSKWTVIRKNVSQAFVDEFKKQAEQPATETQAAEVEKYPIYKTQVKGRGEMFSVPSRENVAAGKPGGFGDSLHNTEADALKQVELNKRLDNQDEQTAAIKQISDEAKNKADAAKREKEQPIHDFTEGLSPMKAGKILSSLRSMRSTPNGDMALWEVIQRRVDDGYSIVRNKEGGRELTSKDGAFVGEKSLGKTGMDFAEHLIKKGAAQTETPAPIKRNRITGKPIAETPVEESAKPSINRITGKRAENEPEQFTLLAVDKNKPVDAQIIQLRRMLEQADTGENDVRVKAITKRLGELEALKLKAAGGKVSEQPKIDFNSETGANEVVNFTPEQISGMQRAANAKAMADAEKAESERLAKSNVVKKLTSWNVETTAKVPAQKTDAGFSPKVAKEQKKFLLDAIEQAVKEASEMSPEEHQRLWQASEPFKAKQAYEDWQKNNPYPDAPKLSDFDYDRESEGFKTAQAQFETAQAERNAKRESEMAALAEPYRSEAYPGEDSGDVLTQGTEAAFYRSLPHVTIQVPGDGEFSILNTKAALEDFKTRAAKFPVSAPKQSKPSSPRTTATAAVPLGKADSVSAAKALEPIVSRDDSRGVIKLILSDGKKSIATNGRMLTIVNVPLGGTAKKPKLFTTDGKLAKDQDQQYPNYNQVIPPEFKEDLKNLDTETLFTVLKQAIETTSDRANSVRLYRNKDGTLGVSSSSPEIGDYSHNVLDGAEIIAAVDPNYFISAINAARRVGDAKITLSWNDELATLRIKSKNSESIIVPMRLSTGIDQNYENKGSGDRPKAESAVEGNPKGLGDGKANLANADEQAKVESDLRGSGKVLWGTDGEIARLLSGAGNGNKETDAQGVPIPISEQQRVYTGETPQAQPSFKDAQILIFSDTDARTRRDAELLAHRILFGTGKEASLLLAGKGDANNLGERVRFVLSLSRLMAKRGVKFMVRDIPDKNFAQFDQLPDSEVGVISFNSNRLSELLSHPETLEAVLSEELIHAATRKVATREEIANVWRDLTPEEQFKANKVYNIDNRPLGAEELGAEYIRIILQDKLEGRTTEATSKYWTIPESMKLILKKLVDFLRESFGKKPVNNYARQIISRVEALINEPSSDRQDEPAANRVQPFYSRLTRTVEQSQQGKATGAQWKATIKNSKIGANADEFSLVGVGDLEDGKTYTKQEVMDYLKANEIQVKDVTLGNHEETPADTTKAIRLDELTRKARDNPSALTDADDREAIMLNAWLDQRRESIKKRTHFESYQLPGGKGGSYREVLLTVPREAKVRESNLVVIAQREKAIEALKRNDFLGFDNASQALTNVLSHSDWGERWDVPDPADVAAIEAFRSAKSEASRLTWRDGHSQYSDVANPIVRLRFNERTTADGKRLLFLEEVQPPQKGEFEKMPALFQKNWREIAFKWALHHASENGFDSIGWTTGEHQAERYDLSKQVESLLYRKNPDGTFAVSAVIPGSGGKLLGGNITEAKLEENFGKEVASKIIKGDGGVINLAPNNSPRDEWRQLKGADLKVGGEGLKKLYDQDFRNVVNNLPAVKKAGQKVGTAKIASGDTPFIVERREPANGNNWERVRGALSEQAASDEVARLAKKYGGDQWGREYRYVTEGGELIHSIEITQPIRDSVMGGQPFAAQLGEGLKPGEGMSHDELHAAVQGVDTAGFGFTVLTKDEAQALTGLKEARGYGGFEYRGKIYLVAENIGKGNAEAAREILREEVGHALMRTADGKALLDSILRRGRINLTAAEREALLKQGYREHQLLDEFIAKSIAEKKTWWKQVVDHVADWLAERGIDLSNAAVARMLLKQIRAKQSGEADAPIFSDSLSPSPARPSDDKEGKVTEVFGEKYRVKDRPSITAESIDLSQVHARNAFNEAGFKDLVLQDIPIGDKKYSNRRIWIMKDNGFNHDAEGRNLVEILRREISQPNSPGNASVENLANSVVLNFELPNSAMASMSPDVRSALWAAAQSYRSAAGVRLAGLAGYRQGIEFKARRMDVELDEIYGARYGGEVVKKVLRKVTEVFRQYFTDAEIRDTLNNDPALEQRAEELILANRQDLGGKVYRKVQGLLGPKKKKTVAALEGDANVTEAVNGIIETAAKSGIVPKVNPNKPLSPLQQLLLMVTPENAAKVQELTAKAVEEGERNAGIKQALREAGEGEREDLIARFELGEIPTREQIEAGLDLPEFAHWKAIRDTLLDYSPITVKLAQNVIKGGFRGTRFEPTKLQPADTRIDLTALAKSPDAEVARVTQGFLDNIEANISLTDATPETVARIRDLMEVELKEQLALVRERLQEGVFALPKKKGVPLTPEQQLAQLINTKIFDNDKLDLPEMVNRLAGKGVIQRLLPTLPDLLKEAFSTPTYKQGDLQRNFVDQLVKRYGLEDAAAERFAAVLESAYKQKVDIARARAFEQSVAALTPTEREPIRKGKTIYEKLERAVKAGAFDSVDVMREIARANGAKVPDAAMAAKIKQLVDEVDRAQEVNDRERLRLGNDPDKIETYRRDKIAASEEKLTTLKHELETYWSRFTEPLNVRTSEGRTNLATMANESVGANLLLRTSFVPKQLIDVGIQAVSHMHTRAIAEGIGRYISDRRAGREAALWKDISGALGESYKSWRVGIAPAIYAAGRVLAGKPGNRNIEMLVSRLRAFDVAEQKAKELDANGEHGKAVALRIFHFLSFGRRIAQAFDNLQGTPVELQEMRHMVVRGLREQGMARAAATIAADKVIGDMAADWVAAIEEARQLSDENGYDWTPGQLKTASFNLVKDRAYRRIEALGLPIDNFEAQTKLLASTTAWNEPIEGGIGGVIANTISQVKKIGERAGIPIPLLQFGNAIGTSINRKLSWTPLGFFPSLFEKDPWYKSDADRAQRKVEAALGTVIGGILAGFVYAGAIAVHLHAPRDRKERELWEREGHRAGTLEINLGDGTFLPFSLTTGPFAMVAPWLVGGGAAYELVTEREKKQQRLNDYARKHGLQPEQLKPLDSGDYLTVAASVAWNSILSGRTVGGIVGATSDYGLPSAKKIGASFVNPLVPFSPGLQELSRMAGTNIDPKLATFWDLIVPLPTSNAQRVNILGDPVGTHSAVQRVVQTLTGGTYIPVDPQDAVDSKPYAVLYGSGYRPPAINQDRGYSIGGDYRPLNEGEITRYTKLRGELFAQELRNVNIAGLSPEDAKKEAASAYRRANVEALNQIGVDSGTRPASGGTTRQQTVYAGALASRYSFQKNYRKGSALRKLSSRPGRKGNRFGFSRSKVKVYHSRLGRRPARPRRRVRF